MKYPYTASSKTLAALLFGLVIIGLAGLTSCTQEIETPPAERMDTIANSADVSTTGRAMYDTYCASCHGQEAQGDGPVATLLTVAPPDLTRIRERNNGTFPVAELYQMIDGRETVPAHGTREMPIWGNAWGEADNAPLNEQAVEQRINLLIEYLRSIQTEQMSGTS